MYVKVEMQKENLTLGLTDGIIQIDVIAEEEARYNQTLIRRFISWQDGKDGGTIGICGHVFRVKDILYYTTSQEIIDFLNSCFTIASATKVQL